METAGVKMTKEESRDELTQDKKQSPEKPEKLTGATDDKYHALLKKAADLEKESKKMSTTIKLQEKRYDSLLREKENLQKDHNKSVLMRTKLEQVCREQQKLLKSVQNESVKHKETQARFQHSINEISSTLSKNNDENIKLKEDNIEMTKKLKYLAEQYQIREKQLEKINEQVQLESQLHDAKLAKNQMEAAMEKEILLKEKQCALDEMLKCKKSIQEQQKREEMLKEQLGLYTSKYDDFQSSLQKSNDVFASYKTELEKMVKKTKKLEKESTEWKRKCEKSTASILDLATEKQIKDEYIAKTTKQMQQLQKLLRTLQAERTTLHKTLKENNIEIPPMPVLPPEPEPVSLPPLPQSRQPDKIESMAKSCAELKQSLALLQDQMSALTTKPTPASEQAAPEVTSKSKNKKNKTKNKSCPVKERNSTEVDAKVNNLCSIENDTQRSESMEKEQVQTNPNDTIIPEKEEQDKPIQIVNDITNESTRSTDTDLTNEKTMEHELQNLSTSNSNSPNATDSLVENMILSSINTKETTDLTLSEESKADQQASTNVNEAMQTVSVVADNV